MGNERGTGTQTESVLRQAAHRSRLGQLWRQAATAMRSSYLYRWLTAEPVPEVIEITSAYPCLQAEEEDNIQSVGFIPRLKACLLPTNRVTAERDKIRSKPDIYRLNTSMGRFC